MAEDALKFEVEMGMRETGDHADHDARPRTLEPAPKSPQDHRDR